MAANRTSTVLARWSSLRDQISSLARQESRDDVSPVPEPNRQHADRLLDGICGTDGERKAYFKLLRLQAERLVDLHWQMVEATATALLAGRTLDGKAILEVIRRASEMEFRKKMAAARHERNPDG